jgi:hypothetical protein
MQANVAIFISIMNIFLLKDEKPALITFVGNLVSAQNITTDISSAGNITDSKNGTNTTETKPSESLTLKGLSPQDESNLAMAVLCFQNNVRFTPIIIT